jgi:hypothetical protein
LRAGWCDASITIAAIPVVDPSAMSGADAALCTVRLTRTSLALSVGAFNELSIRVASGRLQ